jgi:hypothetical protein
MKIFCVGRNYTAHAEELGNEIPDEPVIFMKPKSALLQPHAPFYYPEFTNELHYECELVLRVSKNGKYIQEKFASKYYDAVTTGIDFTARDIQDELKAKGLPVGERQRHGIIRPLSGNGFLLLRSRIRKTSIFAFIKIRSLPNRETRQIWSTILSNLVAYISNFFSVNIGRRDLYRYPGWGRRSRSWRRARGLPGRCQHVYP